MEGERSSLLRRSAPLLAVMALLVPSPAVASSFSPDPPPGAAMLQPDAAPAATSAPAPKPTTRRAATARVAERPAPTTVRPLVSRTPAPAARPAPSQRTLVTHPAAPRSKPKPAAKPSPAAKPRPRLVVPALPPVLVPRFIEAPLSSDPSRALAALALALAALTALSGAGVVFSWSRR